MRRLFYILVFSLVLLQLGCAADGEIKYTGTKADANEPNYIKDPEATGTTHETRTNSNRVDIPVLEFAQLKCNYSGGARMANQSLNARYNGQQIEAVRLIESFESRNGSEWLNARQSLEYADARSNRTLYKGMESEEELRRRLGRDHTTAYSTDSVSWFEETKVRTTNMASREHLNAMKANDQLHAARSKEGFYQASGERIIGLHLYKYANRELVGDGVEVTYTLVYYNTNEYETGPTEINEPVPYYTSFITGSATLPKQGTKVDFIARPGDRDLLRWSFPQGIKAGETGEMKYKVKIILDAPYEQRPPEDQPKEKHQ